MATGRTTAPAGDYRDNTFGLFGEKPAKKGLTNKAHCGTMCTESNPIQRKEEKKMKKVAITTELKAARDASGELIGFRVWRLEPQYYIPRNMVVSYHKLEDEEDDLYSVTLTLPEAAIKALERPGDYVIWDNDAGVEFKEDDDSLYSAMDARAALFWYLEVRGGIQIKRKRAKRN